MTDTSQIPENEIDLIELFETVWDGRWLIVAITAVCVFLGGTFAFFAPKTYTGQFEIRPITSWASQQYTDLNSLDFFNIDRSRLLSLFIEDLSVKDTIAAAIRERSENPQTEDETALEYSDRVLLEAAAFRLVPPTSETPEGQAARNREIRRYWTMEVESSESPEIIRSVLRQSLSNSQTNVRSIIKQSFEGFVRLRRKEASFQLKDINTERNNLFEDYDKTLKKRLSYLEEQAEIARTLDIAKNTLDAQLFQAGSAFVANVNNETPFYLRGYEAIEKEIQLLKDRDNKEAFIADLIKVEQQARKLEQNQLIDRAVVAFNNTPVVNGDFKAATYTIAAMELESNVKPLMVVALSVFGGGLLAIIVVLIRGSIRKRSI